MSSTNISTPTYNSYTYSYLAKFKPGNIVRYNKHSNKTQYYGICLSKPYQLNHRSDIVMVDVWWFSTKPFVTNKKRGSIGISQLTPWPFSSKPS